MESVISVLWNLVISLAIAFVIIRVVKTVFCPMTKKACPKPFDDQLKSGESVDSATVTGDLRVIDVGGELVEYKCGHRFADRYAIDVDGVPWHFTPKYWEACERCGDCEILWIRANARRCAGCGRLVLPSEVSNHLWITGHGLKPDFKAVVGRHRDDSTSMTASFSFGDPSNGICGIAMGEWRDRDPQVNGAEVSRIVAVKSLDTGDAEGVPESPTHK